MRVVSVLDRAALTRARSRSREPWDQPACLHPGRGGLGDFLTCRLAFGVCSFLKKKQHQHTRAGAGRAETPCLTRGGPPKSLNRDAFPLTVQGASPQIRHGGPQPRQAPHPTPSQATDPGNGRLVRARASFHCAETDRRPQSRQSRQKTPSWSPDASHKVGSASEAFLMAASRTSADDFIPGVLPEEGSSGDPLAPERPRGGLEMTLKKSPKGVLLR